MVQKRSLQQLASTANAWLPVTLIISESEMVAGVLICFTDGCLAYILIIGSSLEAGSEVRARSLGFAVISPYSVVVFAFHLM